jgi:hypothetical protein
MLIAVGILNSNFYLFFFWPICNAVASTVSHFINKYGWANN